MRSRIRLWYLVWISLSAFVFLDFISYLMTGAGIGDLIGGTSSPVVAAIAEKVTGMSSPVFLVFNFLAVLVCVYIVYVCYRHEVKA
jgi:hypothetical protein